MTVLIKKFSKIFLLNLSYKSSCVKFYAYSRRNGSFILLQSENVNISENVLIEL